MDIKGNSFSDKLFPYSIHIGEVVIVLNADGSLAGDLDGFETMLKESTDPPSGEISILLWLVLNQIKEQKRLGELADLFDRWG